jgi:hypothetical protein
LAGETRPAGRVAVLLGLLVAAGALLSGRIPDVPSGPADQPQDSPASLAGVVTLLGASLLIMAIAVAASFRRKPVPETPADRRELPREVGGPRARPRRRLLLIAVALAAAWLGALVLAFLLSTAPTEFGYQPRATEPSASDVAGSTSPAATQQQQQQPESDGRVLRYLQVTTVALVAMILVGTVATAVRQQRSNRPVAPDTTAVDPVLSAPGPEPLAVAAERGLAEVGDLSRGPREAIIACYAAMEEALASSPGAAPQDSDTPSEVLARAVGNRALRTGSATTLVEVFAEARFSRHVMTEDHREVAERSLRAVLDELRQPAR